VQAWQAPISIAELSQTSPARLALQDAPFLDQPHGLKLELSAELLSRSHVRRRFTSHLDKAFLKPEATHHAFYTLNGLAGTCVSSAAFTVAIARSRKVGSTSFIRRRFCTAHLRISTSVSDSASMSPSR
jgi:hypothetical protein